MKKVLIAVTALFAIVIVAAVAVPFFVPTETWKNEIEQRATDATGRKLTIAGPVRLSIIPAVALVANDVSIANASGAEQPKMASLGKLEVRVRVLALLSGNLAIERFVVDRPVIHLEIDRQGKPNWDFAIANTKPGQSEPPGPQSKSGGAGLSPIELGDVRLAHGTITYTDARSGARYEARDIDASLKLADLDSPLKAIGSFTWNTEKVALAGEITVPSAILAGRNSNVGLTIDSRLAHLTFAGQATGVVPAKLDGAVAITVPNVRELGPWLGQKPNLPGSGFGPLSIKGTLAAQSPRISFTGATYALDALEASGDVAVNTSGRVPYVKATLATNTLDLNPYLPEAKLGAISSSSGESGPAPTPSSRASQGWSAERIDFSPLQMANADLSLTVAGFRFHELNFGKSIFNVMLKDGQLVVDMPELALYDGKGKGQLTIDGSARVPVIGMTTNLTNVDINPLLKDAMTFEAVTGKANADLALNAAGASQRDLISAMNGKGAVKVEHGAVRGLDLGAMIRNIGSAFSSASDDQETDFSEANGTFTVTNGILRNDDLAMLAPLFHVVGKGIVYLPQRSVSYRIEPKLVADTRGAGGSRDALGIGAPIIVSGSWDKLTYRPDLLGLLPDVNGAARGLRDLLRGGPSNGGQQPPSGSQSDELQKQQPSQNPIDQLRGLFGR